MFQTDLAEYHFPEVWFLHIANSRVIAFFRSRVIKWGLTFEIHAELSLYFIYVISAIHCIVLNIFYLLTKSDSSLEWLLLTFEHWSSSTGALIHLDEVCDKIASCCVHELILQRIVVPGSTHAFQRVVLAFSQHLPYTIMILLTFAFLHAVYQWLWSIDSMRWMLHIYIRIVFWIFIFREGLVRWVRRTVARFRMFQIQRRGLRTFLGTLQQFLAPFSHLLGDYMLDIVQANIFLILTCLSIRFPVLNFRWQFRLHFLLSHVINYTYVLFNGYIAWLSF